MVGTESHGDGSGWVVDSAGTRRWGRFGAAGLLVRAPDPADPSRALVLLQHRALWTASGDTWALTGGARDSHETVAEAALRETVEEAGVDPADLAVRGQVVTSRFTGTVWERRGGTDLSAVLHALRPEQSREELVLPEGAERPRMEQVSTAEVEWTYTTIVADTAAPLETVANNESLELRWVPESEVAAMPLMPAFAAAWADTLRAVPVRLVLDVANVLGSRPDGWWRDRLGATGRLLDRLADDLPRTLALPDGRFGWVAAVDAVVEGGARGVEHEGWFTVHRAAGSGDDEIAAVAAPRPDDEVVVVVTADRGLRARLAPGVVALGPSAVLGD